MLLEKGAASKGGLLQCLSRPQAWIAIRDKLYALGGVCKTKHKVTHIKKRGRIDFSVCDKHRCG